MRTWYASSYFKTTGWGSSSTPGFSRSSKVASGLVFQSSSTLFICWALICRALNCSCSDGTWKYGMNCHILVNKYFIWWNIRNDEASSPKLIDVCLSISTLTSHCKKHLSSISGHHWLKSQFMSFNALTLRQGSLQRRTTTLSALAEMNPRRNTFLHPQL